METYRIPIRYPRPSSLITLSAHRKGVLCSAVRAYRNQQFVEQ
jgi:hypothetical protein